MGIVSNTHGSIRGNGLDLTQIVVGDNIQIGTVILSNIDGAVLLMQENGASKHGLYDYHCKRPDKGKAEIIFTNVKDVDRVMECLSTIRDILTNK